MEFSTKPTEYQTASFDQTGSIKNLKELKVGSGQYAWIKSDGSFLFGDESAGKVIKFEDGNLIVGSGELGDLANLDKVSTTELDTTIISGGKIVTGLLTADNIQAGTLTGRTIRTAAPAAGVGESVVITGGNNQNITFYYDETSRGYIGGYTTEGSEVTYVQIVAASGRSIKLKNSRIEMDGTMRTQKIYPEDDNESELGDLNNRWSKGHFEDLACDDLFVEVSADLPGLNERNLLTEEQMSKYFEVTKREITEEDISKKAKKDNTDRMSAEKQLRKQKRKIAKETNITGFDIGDVLVWDNDRLKLCESDSSSLVMAVASHRGMPCVIGAEPVKVTGKVETGDFLVTSDIKGRARSEKNPKIGTVIAQALESSEGDATIKAMIRKL